MVLDVVALRGRVPRRTEACWGGDFARRGEHAREHGRGRAVRAGRLVCFALTGEVFGDEFREPAEDDEKVVKSPVALVDRVSHSLKDEIVLFGNLHCVELAHGASRRTGEPFVHRHAAGLSAVEQERGHKQIPRGPLTISGWLPICSDTHPSYNSTKTGPSNARSARHPGQSVLGSGASSTDRYPRRSPRVQVASQK